MTYGMSIQDYIAAHPEYLYPATLSDKLDGKIAEGMLLFTEDTADCWSGPFPGNFAKFVLRDCRSWSLRTMAEERLERSRWLLPERVRPKRPIQNEQQFTRLLSLLTRTERQALDEWNARGVENPTVEFPFALRISGNDDCSYSKFFSSGAEGEQELALLSSCQPLDFWKDIADNGYVFTN